MDRKKMTRSQRHKLKIQSLLRQLQRAACIDDEDMTLELGLEHAILRICTAL